MTTKQPPGAHGDDDDERDLDDDDDDDGLESDDPTVAFIERLVEEIARDAAADPGPPDEEAHQIARYAQQLAMTPPGHPRAAKPAMIAVGSNDGEPAAPATQEYDTARLARMTRTELERALAAQHRYIEPVLLVTLSDDELRARVRRRRPTE